MNTKETYHHLLFSILIALWRISPLFKKLFSLCSKIGATFGVLRNSLFETFLFSRRTSARGFRKLLSISAWMPTVLPLITISSSTFWPTTQRDRFSNILSNDFDYLDVWTFREDRCKTAFCWISTWQQKFLPSGLLFL